MKKPLAQSIATTTFALLYALIMVPVLSGQETTEPAALTWRLAEGQQFTFSFTQSIETVSTVNKNALRVRLDLGAELQWAVQTVDESNHMQIEQTIARLTMKMSKSDGSEAIEYDSASSDRVRGAARDVANSAGPLVGLKVHLTLSPRGEIVAVDIPQETREAMEKIQDRSKVAPLFTPDGLSEVMQQAMPLLPPKPVAIGESWNVPLQKSISSGKLNQTTTLTYDGPDETMNGLLKISVTGDVEFEAAPNAPNRVSVKQQELSGTLWYDAMGRSMARGSIHQDLMTESPYRDEMITTRLTSQLDFRFEPIP